MQKRVEVEVDRLFQFVRLALHVRFPDLTFIQEKSDRLVVRVLGHLHQTGWRSRTIGNLADFLGDDFYVDINPVRGSQVPLAEISVTYAEHFEHDPPRDSESFNDESADHA